MNQRALKKLIRRLVNTKTTFQCQRCGKIIRNGNEYQYRQSQYIKDYAPEIQRLCRNCIYTESFGSKGINVRKRNNQIEEETILYKDVV